MITVNVQCFNTFGGILIFSTNHCRCLYLHAWHQAIYIWCDGSYIPQSMTFTVVVSVLGLRMKWVSVLHLLSLFVLNFLQYLDVFLTFQLVPYLWVFFIVEYSFMSTLVWHLFMTSLKLVLNLPAAGVDIITILCHRWKHVNYALFLSPLLGDGERNVT